MPRRAAPEDMPPPRPKRARKRAIPQLTRDQALVALLIGATEANQHTSPAEAARAQHIVLSTRSLRRKGGGAGGGVIAQMKAMVEAHGALAVVTAACRALPRRARAAAFAVVADLVLVDGRIDAAERDFLHGVSTDMGLDPDRAAAIVEVMRLKNGA